MSPAKDNADVQQPECPECEDSTQNDDLRYVVSRFRAQKEIFPNDSQEQRVLEWAENKLEEAIDDE